MLVLESKAVIGMIFILVRYSKNYNQEQMCKILLTTQGNLSKIESGAKLPSGEIVLRMIELFNINAKEFFREATTDELKY